MSTPPVSISRNSRARPLADELLAVARDAGRLVDDGGAGPGQAVDERRLADIREADDRDGPGEIGHGLGRRAFADELLDPVDDVVDVEVGRVDLDRVGRRHHPLGVALVRARRSVASASAPISGRSARRRPARTSRSAFR